jgi:hypothetical protein
VTYNAPPRYLLWKHDGNALDGENHPRISISDQGWLNISQVELTDAGHYTLTASNGALCQRSEFIIFVECEFKS